MRSARSSRLAALGDAVSRRRRTFGFALLCGAIVGYEIYAVFIAAYGVPANGTRSQRYVLGEIAGGFAVSQTMTLETGGFDRVAIHATRDGRASRGEVVFELREVVAPGIEPIVYRIVRPVDEVVASASYTIRFAPIDESKGRRFRLVIHVPGAAAGAGIGLLASKMNGYDGGSLFLDTREQWGDLIFAAGSARGTVFQNLEHVLRDKPALVRSRWVIGALFGLYNWALVTFLYCLVFADAKERL